MDALTEELLREAGLGGRDRAMPSPAERARVSVTKAGKAVRTTASRCPALGIPGGFGSDRPVLLLRPPGKAPPAWSF